MLITDALAAAEFTKDQSAPEEKSSAKISSPTPGCRSGVGLGEISGIRVGVAVGGNHTTVGVWVGERMGVEVGSGAGVTPGEQAVKMNNRMTRDNFFMLCRALLNPRR